MLKKIKSINITSLRAIIKKSQKSVAIQKTQIYGLLRLKNLSNIFLAKTSPYKLRDFLVLKKTIPLSPPDKGDLGGLIKEGQASSLFKSGFSLIESIVVMVILATAMSGAVYLLGTVIKTTARNKDQIKAIYLTQECTELVRNLRDTLWKRHLPWDCMFNGATVNSDNFTIEAVHDGTKSQITSCGMTTDQSLGVKWRKIATEDDSKIYIKGTKYTHDSTGEETPFHRKVVLKEVKKIDGETTEIIFNCEVEWKNKTTQKVILQSLLTNWYKP